MATPQMIRVGDTLTNILDSKTGEVVSYDKVITWLDGTPMDDSKTDSVVYRKLGGEYFKRNFTGALNIKWFGAKGDGITDDTIAIQKALNLPYDVELTDATFKISGTLTMSDNQSFIGNSNSTLLLTGILNIGDNSFLKNLNIDSSSATGVTVLFRDKSNITVEKVRITNPNRIGIQIDTNCTNLLFSNCEFYGCADQGLYIQDSSNIRVSDCVFHNNLKDGFTALRCSNITLNNCISYSNGSTGFNGISVNDSQYCTISNCIAYSNVEHGIGAQGCANVTFSNCISRLNGMAGFFTQSGGDTYTVPNRPCESINFNNVISKNNGLGMSIIEDCRDIIVTNSIFKDNINYMIRLHDRGGNLLKSNNVNIFNNILSGSITNSNSSTSVYLRNNSIGTFNGMSYNFETISEAITVSIAGITSSYPTLFFVNPTGTDIARTSKVQCRAGSIITFVINSGSVQFRNNFGDGITYAGFILKSGANQTFAANTSVQFVGNSGGTAWIQL